MGGVGGSWGELGDAGGGWKGRVESSDGLAPSITPPALEYAIGEGKGEVVGLGEFRKLLGRGEASIEPPTLWFQGLPPTPLGQGEGWRKPGAAGVGWGA